MNRFFKHSSEPTRNTQASEGDGFVTMNEDVNQITVGGTDRQVLGNSQGQSAQHIYGLRLLAPSQPDSALIAE